MKISNFKKYILFIIISFVVAISPAMAADDFSLNGSGVRMSSERYINLNCVADGDLKALTIEKNDDGEFYSFTIRRIHTPSESGTDSVTCSWTGERTNPAYEHSASHQTFTYHYEVTNRERISVILNGTINGGVSHIPEEDIVNLIAVRFNARNVNIQSLNKDSNSEKYVDWSRCTGGNMCVVTPKDTALNQGQTFRGETKVTFTGDGLTGTQEVTLDIQVSYTGGVNAYPGGLGTCGFDSNWKSVSGGTYNYYVSVTSGNVTLPSCTAENSALPVEFQGWTSVPNAEIGNYSYQHVNYCAENGKTVTPAGTSVAPSSGIYVACYKYSDGVRLTNVNAPYELSDESQCTKTDTGEYYCQSSGGTFTLPDLVNNSSLLGKNTKFLGWLKNGSGELVAPGTPVSTTEYAYYAAQYERTVREVDRFKSVYVGQNSFLSVPGMTGCAKSGTADNLDAKYQNGQCLITGNRVTGSGEYVDVTVTVDEDGESKNLTYKFEVRDIGSNSEAGNGSFVIDVDANIVSGENNSYALNDFDHKMCDKVRISSEKNADGTVVRTEINEELNSNNYRAICTDTGEEYFALCMDPGRVGPSNDLYDITEHVNQDSDLGKMIGVIIDYINNYSGRDAFKSVDDPVRLAAHIAIRTVVLINGYSGVTEYSDTSYYSHYLSYEELAKTLKGIYENPAYQDAKGNMLEDNSDFRSAITSAVDAFGVTANPTARDYLIEMFIKYKNYEFKEGGAFQRTIDTKDVTFGDDGNSYTIDYKGTITLPVNTRLTMTNTSNYVYLTKPGVKGTLVYLRPDEASTTDPYQEVYQYEVKIEVTDASVVEVPKNVKAEEEYALEIQYTGGIDYSSIRIGNPYAGSASKQRMIIIDLTPDSTFIYFNIDGGTSICTKLDSLDYTQCTGDDEGSCPSTFNKSLFKASGCCSEVLDEVTYQYVISNVCNSECSVSTMSSVCSYNPSYSGSPDLYEIKEGAYYTADSKKYSDAIGTCIVNVKGNYAKDKKNNAVGTYSSYGEPTGKDENSNYFKYDDKGNSINVSSYQSNEYCQVTCREDWVISLEAFGNFVGKNAVLAGQFFQNANNDIFIQGSRTCYTTYLDYELFMKDLVAESKKMVNNYNTYSNASHAYTDIDNQDYTSDKLVFVPDSGCLEWEYDLVQDKPETPKIDESKQSKWFCSKQNIRVGATASTQYGHYTLSLNHEFEGEGEGKGKYNNYSVTDNGTSDPPKTPTKPQYTQGGFTTTNPDGSTTTADGFNSSSGTLSGTACSFPSKPTTPGTYDGQKSSTEPTTATGGCYKGNTDTNKKSAFSDLAEKMKAESVKIMDPAYLEMTKAANNVNSKYEQFWNCQHFELNNATDDANGKANNPASTDKSSITGEKTFMQILTMFEPFVSYDYDEKLYMTILQDDNILIQYDQLNDKFFKDAGIAEGYSKSTNKKVDATVGFVDACETAVDGTACPSTPDAKVELARNYLEFAYYNPRSGPWTDEDLVKTYGEGTEDYINNAPLTIKNGGGTGMVETKDITLCSIGKELGGYGTGYNKNGDAYTFQISERVPTWEGGKCYLFKVSYLKAHYIKASITNSSFYRNKGIWYTGPNDTREHGDSLENAWDNASKRPGGPTYSDRSQEAMDRWSTFSGTKTGEGVIEGNLNIFPVSMTTARNLYRYTYQFTQIGSYTDGKLGRVMGDASSLIPQNKRTCFYEVVENICLCCGDPIVTYTSEDIPSAEDYAKKVGFDYKFNKKDGYGNAKGTFGLYTTTVALTDLNGSTDRDLGNNWTNKGVFYYGGNKLTTNKGEVALKEIQEQGEKVYLNDGGTTPEYTFELRPSTLAAIRDYNDKYGYEVNFDNLTVYGRASIQPLGECSDPSSCSWFASGSDEIEEMNDYIANFGHYGSNFLETFDEMFGDTGGSAGPDNLSNKRDDSNVCQVVSTDSDSAKEELKRQIASGNCRWIDYIETSSAKNIWDSSSKTQYYRLAFK